MTLALSFCAAISLSQSTYVEKVEQWRQKKEAELKSDNGWLTVAGLYWLEPGPNRAGSGDSNPVLLPPGYPSDFGTFELDDKNVLFRPAKAGEKPLALRSDAAGAKPTAITERGLTITLIERGGKLGIRLRDNNSPMRREFRGLRWYPVQPDYRIQAEWVAYPQPKSLAVPNVLSQTIEYKSIGYAVFQLHGKQHKLEPVVEGQQLFFIFKDQTAGKATYPAGRFLYAEMPVSGSQVILLDFNQAHNPPCAFTPYATCPLPPPQNRLDTAVEAGELHYGKH
jgi:uncharacterized protein